MNKNEAWGLPAGSVRALIAVLLVVGVLIMAIGFNKAEAVTALIALAGVAVANYFNKKSSNEGGDDTNKIVKSEQ